MFINTRMKTFEKNTYEYLIISVSVGLAFAIENFLNEFPTKKKLTPSTISENEITIALLHNQVFASLMFIIFLICIVRFSHADIMLLYDRYHVSKEDWVNKDYKEKADFVRDYYTDLSIASLHTIFLFFMAFSIDSSQWIVFFSLFCGLLFLDGAATLITNPKSRSFKNIILNFFKIYDDFRAHSTRPRDYDYRLKWLSNNLFFFILIFPCLIMSLFSSFGLLGPSKSIYVEYLAQYLVSIFALVNSARAISIGKRIIFPSPTSIYPGREADD